MRKERGRRKAPPAGPRSPSLPTDQWVDFGGQRIWAVDWTEGGFPIGCTEEELAGLAEREPLIEAGLEPGLAGWDRARSLLTSVFAERARGARIEVGRVRSVGAGLSRRQYAAHVGLEPDPGGLSGPYAISIPHEDLAEASRPAARRETVVLEHLSSRALSFRVPAVVAVRALNDGVAMVRTFARGIELDLRAGRQGRTLPWQIVAEIAASIHSVELTPSLRAELDRPATCDEFAQERLLTMQRSDHPLVLRAAAWCRAHPPPGRPTNLIHGDLLGQNILLDPGEPPTVIDWEYASVGDPAYDLAIVTRGVRAPFKLRDGLRRLLDAYAVAGGHVVDPDALHFYELCIIAGWLRTSADGVMPDAGSAQRLVSLLDRIGG